jgi:predicted nucleic acid-binding protein
MVRFWDSSAVIPVCITEATSNQMQVIYQHDADVMLWWATRTECVSAICRLVREVRLTPVDESGARALLAQFVSAATEIAPSEEVRNHAERCLSAHPLRTADALQLGAALVWARGHPTGLDFVSRDARLRDAARREGFTVVPA